MRARLSVRSGNLRRGIARIACLTLAAPGGAQTVHAGMPITEIVDYGQVEAAGLDPRVLNHAFSARDRCLGDIDDRRYLTIIDFGKPSSEDRLYVLDLVAGTVVAMLVAHGESSDPDKDGFADRFSPVPDSRMSSLGGYLTADTYYGAHGLSLRLRGLEETNLTAWERLIVIHGADYVGKHLAEQGWSWGCPAVDYAKIRSADRENQARHISIHRRPRARI